MWKSMGYTALVASIAVGASAVVYSTSSAAPHQPSRSSSHASAEIFTIVKAAQHQGATVIARGPYVGGGHALSAAGGGLLETLRFPDASVAIKPINSTVRIHRSWDNSRCYESVSAHGKYRLSNGTGRLKSASGVGGFSARYAIAFRADPSGTCSLGSTTDAYQTRVVLRGPLNAAAGS
jgi:hypothetical protein